MSNCRRELRGNSRVFGDGRPAGARCVWSWYRIPSRSSVHCDSIWAGRCRALALAGWLTVQSQNHIFRESVAETRRNQATVLSGDYRASNIARRIRSTTFSEKTARQPLSAVARCAPHCVTAYPLHIRESSGREGQTVRTRKSERQPGGRKRTTEKQ